MKPVRLLMPVLIWITSLSCTLPGDPPAGGRPVREVHEETPLRELRIKTDRPCLPADRPLPVLFPPDVFAAWVPSHVAPGRDLLIGGHWIFLKLSESTWFMERPAFPAPEGAELPLTGWEGGSSVPEEKR